MTDLDAAAFRTAMGHFATGVCVVTSQVRPGRPSGLTANAVCSVSLDPLLFLVCLDRGARTLDAVRASGRLAINVLAQDQEALAHEFAGKAAHAHKFKLVGHSERDGAPVLDGVVAWIVGAVRELHEGGDHVIAVAEATAAGAPGGDPLVFHRGGFRSLGD